MITRNYRMGAWEAQMVDWIDVLLDPDSKGPELKQTMEDLMKLARRLDDAEEEIETRSVNSIAR